MVPLMQPEVGAPEVLLPPLDLGLLLAQLQHQEAQLLLHHSDLALGQLLLPLAQLRLLRPVLLRGPQQLLLLIPQLLGARGTPGSGAQGRGPPASGQLSGPSPCNSSSAAQPKLWGWRGPAGLLLAQAGHGRWGGGHLLLGAQIMEEPRDLHLPVLLQRLEGPQGHLEEGRLLYGHQLPQDAAEVRPGASILQSKAKASAGLNV